MSPGYNTGQHRAEQVRDSSAPMCPVRAHCLPRSHPWRCATTVGGAVHSFLKFISQLQLPYNIVLVSGVQHSD